MPGWGRAGRVVWAGWRGWGQLDAGNLAHDSWGPGTRSQAHRPIPAGWAVGAVAAAVSGRGGRSWRARGGAGCPRWAGSAQPQSSLKNKNIIFVHKVLRKYNFTNFIKVIRWCSWGSGEMGMVTKSRWNGN